VEILLRIGVTILHASSYLLAEGGQSSSLQPPPQEHIMSTFTEKAFALFFAVAISGVSFNTLIV
jgi:hypothetical protein